LNPVIAPAPLESVGVGTRLKQAEFNAPPPVPSSTFGVPAATAPKIYSKDPVFGLLGVKNRSQTAETREHCVKYMREIRIDRKFCSCRAVFHAVNGTSIVGVGPVWKNY
jgi:hypothetical protein